MSATADYYALLRVSLDADTAAIRSAYRSLIRRYHPDVNVSAEALATAKAINEAYSCLRDKSRRAAYDRAKTSRSERRSNPPSSHPYRGPRVWSGPMRRAEPRTPWYRPTWGKAVGLGVAAIITSITFTITSTIPPVEPTIAKPAQAGTIRMAPAALRSLISGA